MIANTAGQTKKSCIMALFNMARYVERYYDLPGHSLTLSAAGNIVGPLLFKKQDAPHYVPGVRAVLIIFCILIILIGCQVGVLFLFNKQRQRQRVAHGKPKYIHDTSMEAKYQAYGVDEQGEGGIGQNGESSSGQCESPVLTGSSAGHDRYQERRVHLRVLNKLLGLASSCGVWKQRFQYCISAHGSNMHRVCKANHQQQPVGVQHG
jgi:hypothetical protein